MHFLKKAFQACSSALTKLSEGLLDEGTVGMEEREDEVEQDEDQEDEDWNLWRAL